MLSNQTIQKLNQLHLAQDAYKPNPDITDQLTAKTIVMIVGATYEGKNRVMETTTQLNERFSIAGTRTSREPRQDDDRSRYVYYQNSDEGLSAVLGNIERRSMVQYAVNPYSQLIYGTAIDDYPGEYNLKDVFSSAINNFRHLGFKKAIAITIITDPTVWLARFEERFPRGHPQRQARRDEAVESFTWSLSQTHDHYWVQNIEGDPAVAAKTLIDIALGTSHGQPDTRQLATASVEAARSIVV